MHWAFARCAREIVNVDVTSVDARNPQIPCGILVFRFCGTSMELPATPGINPSKSCNCRICFVFGHLCMFFPAAEGASISRIKCLQHVRCALGGLIEAVKASSTETSMWMRFFKNHFFPRSLLEPLVEMVRMPYPLLSTDQSCFGHGAAPWARRSAGPTRAASRLQSVVSPRRQEATSGDELRESRKATRESREAKSPRCIATSNI